MVRQTGCQYVNDICSLWFACLFSGCPQITSSLQEVKSMEGSTVILECTVVAFPVPKISWFKGGNLLSPEDSGKTVTFDPESGRVYVTMPSAKLEDAGIYRCVIENQHGTASTKCQLHIKSMSKLDSLLWYI